MAVKKISIPDARGWVDKLIPQKKSQGGCKEKEYQGYAIIFSHVDVD